MKTELQLGGWLPLTTTDYPGQLATVAFCQGCPWHCSYCHNPELQSRKEGARLSWAEFVSFLHRRRGLLDGVVFSGGEPTLQASMLDAVRVVKDMGYRVGLHTAGPYPKRLRRLLPWLDWVAMDIKAPFETYQSVTGIPGSGASALESATEILSRGIPHEFRTTVDPHLLHTDSLRSMARSLAELGVRNYVLQACRTPAGEILTQEIPPNLIAELHSMFECFSFRHH